MKIVIGTRGSKLALWQAEWIKSELGRIHPDLKVELRKIKTTGDRILDVPLAKVGGKGLFVKEIEDAMLRREIDIAVHSMKDVPTEFPDGLHLAVICKREDPRDAFISQESGEGFRFNGFRELPEGAVVGTSSLRRACQLLNVRPGLKIEQLRGNVDTRLRKLDEGRFDAIILAAAGIKRLGMAERITEMIPPDVSLPAIGQGAVGIECRIEDEEVHSIISPLNHIETSICVRAERAFLRRLEGGCQVPIAAYAELSNGRIVMDGLVANINGERIIKGHAESAAADFSKLGTGLAEDLLSRGAREILDEVYGNS
ncbi:porphobilinogen deaminase [bacterium BMS3Bbin06]|nr:porphobilinogen deaminase [bacterium BMS3Abin08]GBE33947.1 porphobilinogen deaminase [bacterium BMS3Bbin06]HDO34754.1 hydroxymethylbilane synthase [Nitrospirota bacterium]HDY70081.1 hydroxymethylbilane synthase [Nitrospirota bacterium]